MTEDEWKQLEIEANNDREFFSAECHVVTRQPTPNLNVSIMYVSTTGQCNVIPSQQDTLCPHAIEHDA